MEIIYPSLAEHFLLAGEEANQSKEEPEIVGDEDKNRRITATALKKLDEKKKSWKSKQPFEHDLSWVNWKCGANDVQKSQTKWY